MGERINKTVAAGVVLACLVYVAVSAVQVVVVLGVVYTLSRKNVPDFSDAADHFIDAQIDAGHDDPAWTPEDPLLRSRKVLLFHSVNSRTAKDVSAKLLYLNSIDPKAPIDLYISTQGGWVDNAFTIIDTMRTISAPVNTWAIGGCYSSGALILAAATGRRHATEDAVLMVHSNLDDSREAYTLPRLSRERYERVYKERTRLPADWYPMTDAKARYLSPKEALAFGLVDVVDPVWEPRTAAANPSPVRPSGRAVKPSAGGRR